MCKMKVEFNKVLTLRTEKWPAIMTRIKGPSGPLHPGADKKSAAYRMWVKLEKVLVFCGSSPSAST